MSKSTELLSVTIASQQPFYHYSLINPLARKCIPLNYYPQRDNYSCGYQNLRMILSSFSMSYTLTEIQELIEKAWDEGWDPQGRLELGLLAGTRTWIGTPEIYTCLSYLGIKSIIYDFTGNKSHIQAVVASHFGELNPYPLYLQYNGHSRTIVGIYKQSLLLFDPGKPKVVPYPVPFSKLQRKEYQILKPVEMFEKGERERSKVLKSIRLCD